MSKQSTLPGTESEESESTLGIITESYSKEERRSHLDRITDDLEGISEVIGVYMYDTSKYNDRAIIRIEFDHKKVGFNNKSYSTYKIEKNLTTATSEIKNVLSKYNCKNKGWHNETWQEIEAPRNEVNSTYKRTFYEIQLSMI